MTYDMDEDNSDLLIRALIENCVENFSKHRGIVEELCITPLNRYLSSKTMQIIGWSTLSISVLIFLNVAIIVILLDIRKKIL